MNRQKIADVMPIRKGRVNPTYELRPQLIAQRREHLKLLGIHRKLKVLSLHEILSQGESGRPITATITTAITTTARRNDAMSQAEPAEP